MGTTTKNNISMGGKHKGITDTKQEWKVQSRAGVRTALILHHRAVGSAGTQGCSGRSGTPQPCSSPTGHNNIQTPFWGSVTLCQPVPATIPQHQQQALPSELLHCLPSSLLCWQRHCRNSSTTTSMSGSCRWLLPGLPAPPQLLCQLWVAGFYPEGCLGPWQMPALRQPCQTSPWNKLGLFTA